MDLNKKLEDILDIVREIGTEDEALGALLMESFGIALNTIKQVAENEGHEREDFDITAQVEMVSSVLNVDLEALVLGIVEKVNEDTINNNKEADEETLDFITASADIDDYDTFLKDNNITETLEELKKEV
jgi:hypothetical protein